MTTKKTKKTITSTEAARYLREAADLIEREGWTKGSYCEDGCYCAMGAIAEVSGAKPRVFNFTKDLGAPAKYATRALAEYILAHAQLPADENYAVESDDDAHGLVVSWNDSFLHPTVVVETLRTVADSLAP